MDDAEPSSGVFGQRTAKCTWEAEGMSDLDSRSTSATPLTQMNNLLWPGAFGAQAIHVAAKLAIADILADKSMTAEELAHATKTHTPSLRRLLEALARLGIFVVDIDGRFRNNALSETLRTEHPAGVRREAVFLGSPLLWKPWGELYETVTTGKPAFDEVYGKPFFDYLAGHPDEAEIFNRAMSADSAALTSFVAAYDFSQFKQIVDVGGGQGALLRVILSSNPDVHGVLYDLPKVVAGATDLRAGEVAARCKILEGDFFKAVPEGGDAYVLKSIIHDWSDEEALVILRNCRHAISHDGKLLLIEHVLRPPSNEPDPSGLMDLMMMVLLSGRERTESHFRALLQKAGFSLIRVIPTPITAIIESRPI